MPQKPRIWSSILGNHPSHHLRLSIKELELSLLNSINTGNGRYGNLNIRDKNHLSHIVKVAGKVIGFPQSPLMVIFDQQVLRKARSILDCTNHPLHSELVILSSGRRFRVPRFKSNRSKNSFVPCAITRLNLHM